MWSLLAALILLAIGTTLKAADALHLLKLADKEIARLREQVEALDDNLSKKSPDARPTNTEISHSQRLEEEKENILKFLAEHGGWHTASYAAKALHIGEQLAMHHLESLVKTRLVAPSYTTDGSSTEWCLAEAGRNYLDHHGLLS